MVKRLTLWILRFCRSEDGISLVEGLLVFPLVLLTFSAFIEFTFAMYQWNQTVKAIQFGARKAAVLNPVVADYTATMSADLGEAEGGPMPSTIVSMICDGETLNGCTTDGTMQNLVYGSDDDSHSILWKYGMNDFNPSIEIENVVVSYTRSGLGYVGRPAGVISTVKVSVKDLSFDLPIMKGLFGLNFNMPANPVTVTSEDLSSTS